MSENQTTAAGDRAALIESLLDQSRGTDIPVLLQAKEAAKKAVKDDPSNANLEDPAGIVIFKGRRKRRPFS